MAMEDWLENGIDDWRDHLRTKWWFRSFEPTARIIGWWTVLWLPIACFTASFSWIFATWSWFGVPEYETGMSHGRAYGQFPTLEWLLLVNTLVTSLNGLALILFCWVRNDDGGRPSVITIRILTGLFLLMVAFATLWGAIAAWD
jgi:hypothetical protein